MPDLYYFDFPGRAVLQAGVQAVSEGRAAQQAVQQTVLQQARSLLLYRLLQLRLQVSIQLQAAKQGQQPHQAGLSRFWGNNVCLAFYPGNGQLYAVRCKLSLQSRE